jgi:hypothetical protein
MYMIWVYSEIFLRLAIGFYISNVYGYHLLHNFLAWRNFAPFITILPFSLSFHGDAFKEIIKLKILLWNGPIYRWDLPLHPTKKEMVLIIGRKKYVFL